MSSSSLGRGVVTAFRVRCMAGWENAISDLLQSIEARRIPDSALARAAVLIPLVDSAGREPHVLLTRRSEQVRYHKGQISFPGGARDGAESIESTAVRETAEELGIDAGRIGLLGRFHDYVSTSSFRVTVFVGLLDSVEQLAPSKIEVAKVLTVPLRFFVQTTPESRKMLRANIESEVYFYAWETEVIWGLTARILKDFADALRAVGFTTKSPKGSH